jgi:1,2-phenylacetyl-CoA epoxidase catalytic subunit
LFGRERGKVGVKVGGRRRGGKGKREKIKTRRKENEKRDKKKRLIYVGSKGEISFPGLLWLLFIFFLFLLDAISLFRLRFFFCAHSQGSIAKINSGSMRETRKTTRK